MAQGSQPRGDRGPTAPNGDATGRPASPGGLADRAEAATLGVVLLIGLVLAASVLVLVVGGSAVKETEDRTRIERAEQGLRAFDADVEAVARGDAGTRVVDLDLPDEGDGAVRTEDAGRIVVTTDDGQRRKVLVDRTVGAVEYHHDGTTIAYQAGGVWRGTGANATMVSAPATVYRNGTLTFPIVDLSGAHRVGTDAFRVSKVRTVAPLTDVTAIEDELVRLRIRSDYYGGWAEYFRQRVPGVAVSVDHAAETVTVELGRPNVDGKFHPGIVAGDGDVTVSNGAATVDSRIRAGGDVSVGAAATVTCEDGTGSDCYTEDARIDRQPMDLAIDQVVESVEDSAPSPTVDGGSRVTLDAGTYYLDGNTHLANNDLVLDLSHGNVSLVVDGHLGISGGQKIRVRNGDVNATCCYARVYTTGDVAIANGGAGVVVEDTDPTDGDDSGNATRFQLYGTAEMQFAIGQGTFTGSVYAPRDESAEGDNGAVDAFGLESASATCPDGTDVCLGEGNGVVTGGIVAGPTYVGQATGFVYDADLKTVEPTVPVRGVILPPDLTFMHLSVHEVTLEEE